MNLHPKTNDAYRLLHDGVLALSRAEHQGMRIDMDYCERMNEELTGKIEILEDQFMSSKFYKHWKHSLGGKKPNINSNSQLAKFIYKTKGIEPVKTTESGQGAADEEALNQLNIPELNNLIQIRKYKKIRDTYLSAFIREQVNGYIHPFFNLHTVRTFRSSSDRPNFQNIPKRDKEAMEICRRAIFPRPGNHLLEVDYGALEVKIAACYHKDPTMMKYIWDDYDMHSDTAAEIYLIDNFNKGNIYHKHLRAGAKNGFVFPQFYGDYYKSCAISLASNWGSLPTNGKWKKSMGVKVDENTYLSDHLMSKGIRNFDTFTEHIRGIETDFWQKRFPVYSRWKEKHWKRYQKNGYVDLLTGFRCKGLMSRNDSINYPVQGAAFHCLLWSLIEMDRIIQLEGLQTKIVGQIHDALILDVVPEELEYVGKLVHRITTKDLPEAWDWINIPLVVEADLTPVDGSWADLKGWELPTF